MTLEPAKMITWTRGRKLALFAAITFGGAWTLAIVFTALGGDWHSPVAAAAAVLFTLPPAFGALIVKGPLAQEPVAEHLALRIRPNRWFVFAWLVPLALIALTLGVGLLMPGVTLAASVDDFIDFYRSTVPADHLATFEAEVRSSGTHPVIRMLLQGLASGATFGAIVALSEELAWRGFLHHELGGARLRVALLIGLICALFRAPLVAFGAEGSVAVALLLMTLSTLGLAPVYAFVREKSGSVIAAAILHGTFNAVAHLPAILTRGGAPYATGTSGVAGVIAAFVLCGLVLMVGAGASGSADLPRPDSGRSPRTARPR